MMFPTDRCETKGLSRKGQRARDNYQDDPGHELTEEDINNIRNRL